MATFRIIANDISIKLYGNDVGHQDTLINTININKTSPPTKQM